MYTEKSILWPQKEMSLPDSFYIALCMTVLLVGAIYWVWTQIQFVQRKVNVLENIVYELKTLCSKPASDSYTQSTLSSVGNVANTLQHVESSHRDELEAAFDTLPTENVQDAPVSPSQYPPAPSSVLGEDEDLLHEQLHEIEEQAHPLTEHLIAQDHEIAPFVEEDAVVEDLRPGGIGSGEVDATTALDGMSVKDLRRMAEREGISGVKEMKKKDLIVAIRSRPSPF